MDLKLINKHSIPIFISLTIVSATGVALLLALPIVPPHMWGVWIFFVIANCIMCAFNFTALCALIFDSRKEKRGDTDWSADADRMFRDEYQSMKKVYKDSKKQIKL